MIGEGILRRREFFSTLADEELRQVAAITSQRECEAGAAIFQEGEKADLLHLVTEGKVALLMVPPKAQASAGHRMTIDIVSGDQVFGWSAIVPPHVYTLTAVCLQNASILSISGTRLLQLFEDNPYMGYKVMKELIKVVASRLDDTRRVLLGERVFA